MVERTLSNGTTLRLKIEPLPEGRVKVLEYHRRVSGERWQRVREEEGRVLVYSQLNLAQPFDKLFAHWLSLA